jgi:quercetin dioxygenase-like cupin family protein
MAAPQIVRTSLLAASLDGSPTVERVQVTQIDLGPSQAPGRHYHPCPVIGYVVAGRIRFQIDGEAERRLGAGDAFFEPANITVLHFDNASDQDSARFIASYLLPPGEDRVIVPLA